MAESSILTLEPTIQMTKPSCILESPAEALKNPSAQPYLGPGKSEPQGVDMSMEILDQCFLL